jgi:hypothetical protein
MARVESIKCPQCGRFFAHNITQNPRQRFCSRPCARLGARNGPAPKPIAERFWPKVQQGDGCWLWIGTLTVRGYGQMWAGSRRAPEPHLLAHRVMWALTHGSVPPGLDVLHHCDVRHCVRPDHLFLGTQADNARDAWRKGRMAHVLTPGQVREIRASSETLQRLADRYNVSKSTIHLVRHRQIHRTIS